MVSNSFSEEGAKDLTNIKMEYDEAGIKNWAKNSSSPVE